MMKTQKSPTVRLLTLLAPALAFGVVSLVASDAPVASDLRAGKNYMETRVYTAGEDQEILKAFEGLRVADVTDGMDFVGLQNVGLMDTGIVPLWKDAKDYKHRFIGIAVTVRYVPTQRPAGGRMPYEDFRAWEGKWYNELSHEPFQALLRPGSALIIEEAPDADVGSIGSNNIMSWKLKGCVGVVTDATARDTDEIITEEVPLYFRRVGRGIRPGRNEVESVNRPVVVGSVLVMPGDVIVADGDGVLVVPRAVALEVAAYAQKIIESDKAGRRNLYKALGLPEDKSVQ